MSVEKHFPRNEVIMRIPHGERLFATILLVLGLGLVVSAGAFRTAATPLLVAGTAMLSIWTALLLKECPRIGSGGTASDPRVFLRVLRFAQTGVWIYEPGSGSVHLDGGFQVVAGIREQTPRDMALSEFMTYFVHPEDRDMVGAWLDATPTGSDSSSEICFRTIDQGGSVRHLRSSWFLREGEDARRIVLSQDIGDVKRLEEKLLRGVLYDALTGLPNRTLFEERIAAILRDSRAEFVGVALMDLDHFLAVNASLGRDAGDTLLLGLAVRLVGSLPPGTTVARVGEDEFAALLEISDPDDGIQYAETMRQALASPLTRGERAVSLTASVGLVLARREGCNAETLLQRAETALFQARHRGGDSVAVLDERQWKLDREEVTIGLELRQAALHDELELHFQPVVRLSDLVPVGFEALVRWRRPGVGQVPPGMFIPIAEQNGSIGEIGLWVLHEGLATLSRWSSFERELSMAINLSPRQMEQDDIVERVREALVFHRVPPRSVKLEITESALAGHPMETSSRIAEMRGMGVRISLDDFGTGYSSLGHLHRFPVDTLKIDKSFVDLLLADDELSPVPRAVVGLAHAMNMDVVAEGIEKTYQLERIRGMGCEMGQGYLFSRPLPKSDAEEWLRSYGAGGTLRLSDSVESGDALDV